MKPNPWNDVVHFLLQPGWTTVAFWVLMLASVGVALYAWCTVPDQRRAIHVGNWACRFFIGAMWWQQTLWKLPPYYTDHPGSAFGKTGLAYWM
ncbi:MAG: hypothetical protein ACREFQ_09205, partial [Stellaceae bacterium]